VHDEDDDYPEDPRDWQEVLGRLGAALDGQVESTIRIDGVVRIVSDTYIIVIKRNEARMWTSTAAREDAEATLLQVMALQDA
jgi:UDP-N-acetylglucosamine enolpyruvyl transferase